MDLKIPRRFWFKPLRHLYIRCRTERFTQRWAVTAWISSSRLPGAYSTRPSMAMPSGEDPAALPMGTDLQPRRRLCDGDWPAPQRGQHTAGAAWVWRALPGTYRRLSPAGLGESFRSAKSKSTLAEMEMPKRQMR